MQKTPMSSRPHIAVFGKRNVGKSSLINALTNQQLALVSDVAGTTTDPVYKSMELLPLGPVVMIDTAGIDDTGVLGELRVKKTREVLRKTDLAVLVVEAGKEIEKYEEELFVTFKEKGIPVVVVINKTDLKNSLIDVLKLQIKEKWNVSPVEVSAESGQGIEELREVICKSAPREFEKPHIIGDLINPGDIVVLVTPIDASAPKGRLILPQVQTLRDILDHDAMGLVTKETELKQTLEKLENPPAIVVTDSQVFGQVDEVVPDDVLLTSFSILFARYKGDLKAYLRGINRLKRIKPGERILIAEACTHRRTHEDIGTVKIPRWFREKAGGDLEFNHVVGREYPENLNEYDLVVHCGGCMLNRREILGRLREAERAGVPVVNYGMAIAYLHGILDRALKPFSEVYSFWIESNSGS